MAITRGRTSSIRQGGKNTSLLAGYPPTMAAPTATAGVTNVSVAFTAVSGATSYTAISNPGNITATGTSTPIIVPNLTAGTAYTFRISATNAVGTSNYSVASNSVTPISLVLMANTPSPYVTAYPFSGSGFGTKYSNPATLPAGFGTGTAYNRQTNTIVVAHGTSPFISAYPFDTSTGFGTKFANPATAVQASSGNAEHVAFNPAGDAISIAVTTLSSPMMQAYRWSSAGFGTKYSNASPDVSNSSAKKTAWHPSGNAVASGSGASPWVQTWAWTSASGFGTAFSNPGSLPPGHQSVTWNPAGTAIGVTYSNSSPYVLFYPWSSGFGTAYGAPGTPPPGVGWEAAWHPNGNFVAVAHSTSPFISAWNWSSGWGSKLSNPGTLPPDTCFGVAFDTPGNNIAVVHSTSPNMSVYAWSSGFGTRYANPATLPGVTIQRGITFI
jgi:hypothetical protein